MHITYRSDIVTQTNEVRNNIIQVSLITNGQPFAPLAVNLSVTDVPAGITLTVGDQSFMPLAAQTLMAIKTSPATILGDYMFSIGVEAGGQFYGSVPCIIHVQQ